MQAKVWVASDDDCLRFVKDAPKEGCSRSSGPRMFFMSWNGSAQRDVRSASVGQAGGRHLPIFEAGLERDSFECVAANH